MGSDRREFDRRGSVGDGDLERLRERLLDHPDDAVGGNDSSSTANGNQIHIHGGFSRTEAYVIAGLAAFSFGVSLVAIWLVLFRLDDYADQLATEKRLQTQAIDELRVEANVSRKLAGLPPVNYQEHD